MAVNQTPMYSPQMKGLSSPSEVERYGSQMEKLYSGAPDQNQPTDYRDFQLQQQPWYTNLYKGVGHGVLKAGESTANFVPDVFGAEDRWATFSDSVTDNKHSMLFQGVSDMTQLGVGWLMGGPIKKVFSKGAKATHKELRKQQLKRSGKRGKINASRVWNTAKEGVARGAIAEMIAFRGGDEHLMLGYFFENNPEWSQAFDEATANEGWENESTTTVAGRLEKAMENILGRATFATEGALIGAAANFIIAGGKAAFRAATKNTDAALHKAGVGMDESGEAMADTSHAAKEAKKSAREVQEEKAFKEMAISREILEDKYLDMVDEVAVKEAKDAPLTAPDKRNVDLVPDAVDDVYRDITTKDGINRRAYVNKKGPTTTREKWEKTLKVHPVPYGSLRKGFKPLKKGEARKIGAKTQAAIEKSPRVRIRGDVAEVDANLINKDWLATGKSPTDFTHGVNFNARELFDNVDEFGKYLIEVEKAKRLFPKLVGESAEEFAARAQRHAVNEAKRRGWGHFYKYEFDGPKELEHLRLTKQEQDLVLFKKGESAAGIRLVNMLTGKAKASPHALLTAAEQVLRLDTSYSDQGMKYFQGRLMSLFMTSLRKNIVKIGDKKTMAQAIGYLHDPKGSDLASILSDTMMDGIEELATSNGLTRRSMMHRLLKGRGNMRNVYKDLTDESVFEYGKRMDVESMKEMNVRIMAYRLENAISMKRYRDLTRKIAGMNEDQLQGSQFLKDYIVELERAAARVESIQKLSRSSGRVLRAWHDLNDPSMSGLALTKEVANFGGVKKLKANAQRAQAIFDGADDGLSGAAAAGDALTKTSLIDMHNEYWINSILSGTKTQMVNTISTGLHMYYKPLEGMLGSMKEPGARRAMMKTLMETAMINAQVTRVLGKLGLNKLKKATRLIDEPQYLKNRDDIFGSGGGDPTNRYNQAVGAVAGARKSFRTAEGTLTKGADLFDVVPPKAISRDSLSEGASDTAKSALDYLGNMIRIPSRLMIGTDELFKQISFRSAAMGQLAADGYELAVKKGLKPDAKYISEYVGEHFHGMIRASGARHTKKNVRQEGRNMYKREVEKANDEMRPFEETEREYLDNYERRHYKASQEELSNTSMHWAEDVTFTRRLDADLQELKDLNMSPTQRRSWTQDTQEMVHNHPWMRLIMPFVKTPVNILKWPMQRMAFIMNPNGKLMGHEFEWVKKIHLRYQADLASKNPFRIAQAEGRIAAGRLYWGGFMAAALTGTITGAGPSNPRERRNKMATGWRPYSFHVGDVYISYARLDPFATALGLAADVYEKSEAMMRHGDVDDDWLQGIMLAGAYSLSNNMADKSYLAGINGVLEATIDPEHHFPALLKKQMTSYIPKIISQWTPITDDNHIKKTYSILEGAMSKVPFASNNIEPLRNYMGEPMEAMYAPSVWASGFNPFLISRAKNDPILEEIAELGYGFGAPTPRIKGDRHLDMRRFKNPDTGRSAFDRYQELIGEIRDRKGRNLRDAMTILFDSNDYRNASLLFNSGKLEFAGTQRDPRVKMVRGLMAQYRTAAKGQTLNEYPDLMQAIETFDRTVFEQLMQIQGRR